MPFARQKICAVVAARSSEGMQRQLRRAFSSVGLVELRMDWLRSAAEIRRFLAWLARNRTRWPHRTLIATCRSRSAGGRFSSSITAQIGLLVQAVASGCDCIDIEFESARTLGPALLRARFRPACCIVSHHTFTSRRITRAAARAALGPLAALEAPALKVALRTNSLSSALDLLSLSARRRNVIPVPMGDEAFPARILALRHSGAFAYAAVGEATAPGQPDLDDLLHLYRAPSINRLTRFYGVAGDPIAHSLSPHLHNAAFASRSINAVYLPFLIHRLDDLIRSIPRMGLRGFSVTLPHKQAILRYLDECDPLAAEIGAVNTVVVRGSGRLVGYNTDYVGVLGALQHRLPLNGSRILLLGAGGAARAVAFALSRAGSAVFIASRRPAAARSLARAIRGGALPLKDVSSNSFDAIVNATPVGMHPHAAASPLPAAALHCQLVSDLVYRPAQTRLLSLARSRGIATVSGLDMFVAQGAAQWEIWTGERAPERVMRRAVETALRQEQHT
jgi:3-dehydroquinate dehydratase/shikimate dehydrogenase